MALVFIIAREGRVPAGLRRQVRSRVAIAWDNWASGQYETIATASLWLLFCGGSLPSISLTSR